MCGILGKVSNSKIDKYNFNNDLSLLNHRGPDSRGTFFNDNIALGHTRLSIIDLSAYLKTVAEKNLWKTKMKIM